MKSIFCAALLFFGLNAFATGQNPCQANEQQGLMLIMQSISQQVVGTPVYSDDFQTLIHLETTSGDHVLSVAGLLHHSNKAIAAHGLLQCNSQTGEYEFAGAGTSN